MIFLQWMKSSRLTKSTDSIEEFIKIGDISHIEEWAEKIIHEFLTLSTVTPVDISTVPLTGITVVSQQNKQSWSVLHKSHVSKISCNNIDIDIELSSRCEIADVIIVCVEKKIFMHLVSSDFIAHEEDFSYLLQKFYDIHKSELDDMSSIKLHILQFEKVKPVKSSL